MRLDGLSHALIRPIRTSAPCSRLNLGDSSQQVAVLALVTVRPNSGLDPRSRRNEFLHLLPNVHAPPQRLHLDSRFDGISEDTERLASLAGPERSLNTSSRSSLPLQLLPRHCAAPHSLEVYHSFDGLERPASNVSFPRTL